MPLIQIHLREGRSAVQKKALLRSVTRAVHESIGAPLPSIRVLIREFATEDYMIGGEPAAESMEPGG